MGKVLIIKGADFSDIALDTITPGVENAEYYPYGYYAYIGGGPWMYNTVYSVTKMLRVNNETEITILNASTGTGCGYAVFFNAAKQKISEVGVSSSVTSPTKLTLPEGCKYVVLNSRNHTFGSGATDPIAVVANLDGIEDWPIPVEEWANYPSA